MSAAATTMGRWPTPSIDAAQHLVRLAATCMAEHDIRYYINGIYFEPREAGGIFIVATNGHRLMVVIDESGSASDSAIISVDRRMAARMVRPAAMGGAYTGKRKVLDEKISNRFQTDVFRGKTAALLTDNCGQVSHVRADALVEGKFPDWRRVLPDFEKLKPGAMAPYNPRYLSSVLEVFGDKRGNGVMASPYQVDPTGAIVFHLRRHENALLIVMPMRDEPADGKIADLFKTNWSTADARRARRPADPPPQDSVAVPAERGAAAEGGEAQAGAERATSQEAAAGESPQAPPA